MPAEELIVNALIEKLKKQGIYPGLLNVLLSVDNTITKIKVVEEIWLKSGINPQLLMRVPKSNIISREHRAEGNFLFSKAKTSTFIKALDLYNLSVCYAEASTEDLAIGYANRSAVYFELKMFNTCLENMKLAIAADYPKRLMPKLINRKKLCYKMIRAHADVDSDEALPKFLIPQLSRPPHPRIPFIASCLDIRSNAQYGRYIITTKNLHVGEIIAIEDTFCEKMTGEMRYQRCEHCLREKFRSLIPCKVCTAVMFCSEQCYEEGMEKFHKYECPIIDYIYAMLTTEQMCSMRTVIRAITVYPNYNDLVRFVQGTRGEDHNLFTVNYNKDPFWIRQYYPVHALVKSKEKKQSIFLNLVITCIIYRALLDHTTLSDIFNNSKAIETLIELIYQHLLTVTENASGMTTLSNVLQENDGTTDEPDDFAAGMYPFRGLLNHSCAPNILCASAGKKMVVSVLKPIKANQQLFDNYL